ncbi:MAG: C1 family peptidase [Micrococcales bacterium]|nr:C1 family peptidase [Micrococcales bacterium]
MASALETTQIDSWRTAFAGDKVARLVQNAVTRTSIDDIALDRSIVASIDTSMSTQLDTWKVANQKKSGRCWLFAGLNFLKQHVITGLDLEWFEFSQNYLHFYDKLEKSNWFLTSMIELADRPLDDRLVAHLLADPVGDGGQWDMFVSLVDKYGVVPQYAMPETESSSATQAMNRGLETLLRRGTRDVRDAAAAGRDADGVRRAVLADVHRLLSIHLGTPPATFVWQWRDKDKAFGRGGEMTPQQFASHVIDVTLDDYVCVVNDPRATSPYGSMLTVDHLGNVVGGRPIAYLNAEADALRALVRRSLEDGRVCWFGCDVGKQFDRASGFWDAHLLDYEGAYGIDLQMTKAERMGLGESAMTHAMLFTGIDVLDDRIRRYRVENSWGDERSDKGFDTMNDSWFGEHVFELAVRRADLPPALLAALDTKPIVLPRWDPMGALA